MNCIQKNCNLPAERYWRCSISSKLTMPLPKMANSCEAGLSPSWLSSPSPKPHTLGDRYQLATNEAEHAGLCSTEQAEQRGPAGNEGKVWQSDVVLLSGNIRQRSPLQINVQQVLGV